MRSGRERGSATIWVFSCCALLLVVGSVAALRGAAVLARHRAGSTADLAALAAAGRIGVDGTSCTAAARVAKANGGQLDSCLLDLDPGARSGTVRVTVLVAVRLPVVGRQQVLASARAGRLPSRDQSGP